jgi:Glycosyl transferase family 11
MNSRILVEARGGLGNQLFAYVAARYFSQTFEISTSVVLRDNHHSKSSISRLGLEKQEFGILDGRKFTLTGLLLFILKFTKKMRTRLNFFDSYLLADFEASQHEAIEKRILANRRNHVFYLQSYFADLRYLTTEVIDDLKSAIENFAQSKTNINYQFLETDYLSLHVRGGDYLAAPQQYGVLALDYYLQAIALAQEAFPGLQIRVWSDDYVFAKSLLAQKGSENLFIFMDAPELQDPIITLYCMSKSKFHILSLSTFSYWSAILSDHPQIVIYPRHNQQMLTYVENVPQSWIAASPSWYNL